MLLLGAFRTQKVVGGTESRRFSAVEQKVNAQKGG